MRENNYAIYFYWRNKLLGIALELRGGYIIRNRTVWIYLWDSCVLFGKWKSRESGASRNKGRRLDERRRTVYRFEFQYIPSGKSSKRPVEKVKNGLLLYPCFVQSNVLSIMTIICRNIVPWYPLQVRNRIASSNVNPFDLTIIDQNNCSNLNETMRVEINGNTFSSQNIGQAVRKVGSKIGDGVEYVIEGGKKLVKMASSEKKGIPDNDAEWMP